MKTLWLLPLLGVILWSFTEAGGQDKPQAETTAGWVRHPQNPVLGGDLGTCFDVSVLKEGGTYRMWHSEACYTPLRIASLKATPKGRTVLRAPVPRPLSSRPHLAWSNFTPMPTKTKRNIRSATRVRHSKRNLHVP